MIVFDWIAGLLATVQEIAGLLVMSLQPRRP